MSSCLLPHISAVVTPVQAQGAKQAWTAPLETTDQRNHLFCSFQVSIWSVTQKPGTCHSASCLIHPACLCTFTYILTFPVPSYYTTPKILCSHALTPSWTFLWLLYPHQMSYSMAPYSRRLNLTICCPPALGSSTFEVCHLVFILCV